MQHEARAMAIADAMVDVDGHQPERDGFALLGSSHSSFSLYLFMIYPFLTLPWTD
jgi:hypothetical protein